MTFETSTWTTVSEPGSSLRLKDCAIQYLARIRVKTWYPVVKVSTVGGDILLKNDRQ